MASPQTFLDKEHNSFEMQSSPPLNFGGGGNGWKSWSFHAKVVVVLLLLVVLLLIVMIVMLIGMMSASTGVITNVVEDIKNDMITNIMNSVDFFPELVPSIATFMDPVEHQKFLRAVADLTARLSTSEWMTGECPVALYGDQCADSLDDFLTPQRREDFKGVFAAVAAATLGMANDMGTPKSTDISKDGVVVNIFGYLSSAASTVTMDTMSVACVHATDAFRRVDFKRLNAVLDSLDWDHDGDVCCRNAEGLDNYQLRNMNETQRIERCEGPGHTLIDQSGEFMCVDLKAGHSAADCFAVRDDADYCGYNDDDSDEEDIDSELNIQIQTVLWYVGEYCQEMHTSLD